MTQIVNAHSLQARSFAGALLGDLDRASGPARIRAVHRGRSEAENLIGAGCAIALVREHVIIGLPIRE